MRSRAFRVAFMGILFSLSLVLSFLESGFSAMLPIPGIKLGLSNVVVMFCLFCLRAREAYLLAGLKALFVLLTRGAIGAAMSLGGGIISVSCMLFLLSIAKNRLSSVFISIMGGVFHNIGQLAIATLVLKTNAVFYYFPVLAVGGIGMGLLTGLLLKNLLPQFQKLAPVIEKRNKPEEEFGK